MQFAAGTCAGDSLGSIMVDPGKITDPTASRPILTEINGVDARTAIAMNTLQIQDTVGQPVTANFTMVNPTSTPQVGDKVRIFYYSQLIFAGTMDHVKETTPDVRTFQYAVDCLDWSQILFRRKMRRNFTSLPIQNILSSMLNNELIGESLTVGTIDSRVTVPLVDSRGARVFDVLRDVAGATGQTLYIDFDKSIQMRSTTVQDAPFAFSEANVLMDGTTYRTDRETYRNVQTVTVTGTPQVQNETALVSTQQRRNADQIAARAAIEGGTGIYEEMEDITHPTSNTGTDIALLGIGYARLRLATSGTPRVTITCRVRGYGFRAGQIATVSLTTFGIVGTFVIQRVTISEQAGTFLFHDLELTSSSLQQRAYEAWLTIVKGGKVTVQMPGSLTNNLQTFNTPSTTTWTVPAGVTTAEFTCIGASGGGSDSWIFATFSNYASGGAGGDSGKAVSIVTVIQGQVYDIVIGAKGAHGFGTAGSGGLSSVKLSGTTLCQGDLGGGGGAAYLSGGICRTGPAGSTGGGIGDAVSVGGGKIGGLGGTAVPIANGTDGQDGLVEVRW